MDRILHHATLADGRRPLRGRTCGSGPRRGRPTTDPRPGLLFVAVLISTGALWLASPAAASAQSESLEAVLDSLPRGERVRVEALGRTDTAVGTLAGREAGSLSLETGGGGQTIALEEIQRLWTVEGHLGGEKAKNGALIGAGFGVLTAILVAAMEAPADHVGDVVVQGIYISPIFALPAAALGYGLGYQHGRQRPDWRLRFAADRGAVGLRLEVPLR